MEQVNSPIQDVPNIIIVDDVPANLKILGNILKFEGYKVRPVPNGIMALKVAAMEKPDLILLDIMMPDMDGFEVCRRLKEDPKLKDIPVIFISALNDTRDVVKALKSGGVDFITKPFQAEEVIARVKTHLDLYRQSKRLEKQSKELQALIVTKDKFFSIIAHDLRGPLGGFMQLTEMMAAEFDELSPEEQKEMTIELSHSTRNIFNLLENLLEWSRMQQGQTAFQPLEINLHELASECIHALMDSIKNKSILLEVDIPGAQNVLADKNMIQSVIRNLVSNAVKFTPRGGKVYVSADFTEKNTLVFVVRDTGIGMNNGMISNLFQINGNIRRPGTEGEQSTGLGLLLCKEFVAKHGGELWVESEEGKGTAFYFTIPDNKISEDLTVENEILFVDDTTINLVNPKVLIVEDNENSMFVLKIITNTFSNRVLVAATGAKALEICHSNADIDLILMDIKLPDLDGLETTRQIREFNKSVIIIAQTAFGLNGDRELAIDAGCNDYIAKPINTAELLELLKKYFNRNNKA